MTRIKEVLITLALSVSCMGLAITKNVNPFSTATAADVFSPTSTTTSTVTTSAVTTTTLAYTPTTFAVAMRTHEPGDCHGHHCNRGPISLSGIQQPTGLTDQDALLLTTWQSHVPQKSKNKYERIGTEFDSLDELIQHWERHVWPNLLDSHNDDDQSRNEKRGWKTFEIDMKNILEKSKIQNWGHGGKRDANHADEHTPMQKRSWDWLFPWKWDWSSKKHNKSNEHARMQKRSLDRNKPKKWTSSWSLDHAKYRPWEQGHSEKRSVSNEQHPTQKRSWVGELLPWNWPWAPIDADPQTYDVRYNENWRLRARNLDKEYDGSYSMPELGTWQSFRYDLLHKIIPFHNHKHSSWNKLTRLGKRAWYNEYGHERDALSKTVWKWLTGHHKRGLTDDFDDKVRNITLEKLKELKALMNESIHSLQAKIDKRDIMDDKTAEVDKANEVGTSHEQEANVLGKRYFHDYSDELSERDLLASIEKLHKQVEELGVTEFDRRDTEILKHDLGDLLIKVSGDYGKPHSMPAWRIRLDTRGYQRLSDPSAIAAETLHRARRDVTGNVGNKTVHITSEQLLRVWLRHKPTPRINLGDVTDNGVSNEAVSPPQQQEDPQGKQNEQVQSSTILPSPPSTLCLARDPSLTPVVLPYRPDHTPTPNHISLTGQLSTHDNTTNDDNLSYHENETEDESSRLLLAKPQTYHHLVARIVPYQAYATMIAEIELAIAYGLKRWLGPLYHEWKHRWDIGHWTDDQLAAAIKEVIRQKYNVTVWTDGHPSEWHLPEGEQEAKVYADDFSWPKRDLLDFTTTSSSSSSSTALTATDEITDVTADITAEHETKEEKVTPTDSKLGFDGNEPGQLQSEEGLVVEGRRVRRDVDGTTQQWNQQTKRWGALEKLEDIAENVSHKWHAFFEYCMHTDEGSTYMC